MKGILRPGDSIRRDPQVIAVVRKPGVAPHLGLLRVGPRVMPTALGPNGLTVRKREGDGATPIGRLALRLVLYRPDRVRRPRTALPVRALRRDDGWCDDPADRNYNRLVRLPYPASAERLWRDDHVYDLIVVLGWNDRPRIRGLGSAIFLHCAQTDFRATEGCIALARSDLLRLLLFMTPNRP